MQEQETPAASDPGRWDMVRDMLVLQFKLIVDGFRDLLLVPASLIAGIVSLVNDRDGKPGPQFYQLVAFGKQTEQMINLFGAAENAPEDVRREYDLGGLNLDDLVDRVETFVVDEYRKGGVTAQAKDQIDRALDTLRRSKDAQPGAD
ncbi:MAG: hypothetical protein AAGE85_13510 [Pseudomonadota bacterium]